MAARNPGGGGDRHKGARSKLFSTKVKKKIEENSKKLQGNEIQIKILELENLQAARRRIEDKIQNAKTSSNSKYLFYYYSHLLIVQYF